MTNKKLHVALLFGGNSSEHDVSKRSAHNVFDAMDKNKYDVSLFMFTKDGILLNNEYSQRIFDGEPEDAVVKEAYANMDLDAPLAPIQALSTVKQIDFFIPVIHGNLGEDGTVQGLFRLLKKPYIGSGIAASAMSFDKDLTKKIITQAGIRNTPYILLTPENRDQYDWHAIQEELGDLVFVKPAKQGSSVGIHKVENEAELKGLLLMMPLSMTLRSWLSRGLTTLVKLKSQFLAMSIQLLLSLAVSEYQAMTHSTTMKINLSMPVAWSLIYQVILPDDLDAGNYLIWHLKLTRRLA
jgi:hypothetical protein